MELLRIVAMFLVLVVHADFWSLGEPTSDEFLSNPRNPWIKTIIESMSIVCVNVFVLISGWFKIKFSFRGFLSFIFQCSYFLFGIYIFLILIGCVHFSLRGIADCLCLTRCYWFVKAYAGLYILSPVLNKYLENSTEKLQRVVLLCFFLFQTIYGWSNSTSFIGKGCSTFSFIGLYLLANYTRLYLNQYISHLGLWIYLLTTFLLTLQYGITIRYNTYAYVNPLVIIGALGLLVWFGKLKIQSNKYINWIAKSSFAVYLFHINPNIGEPIFKTIVNRIYEYSSGFLCIGIICIFLIFIFASAIVLDQPRKLIWSCISKKILK